ncbi:MAG: xylulokinase [Planctomycetota bacterium]
MSIFLGVDIGTSGTKTIAVDPLAAEPEKRVLAQSSAAYSCNHPKPLWSEQDPGQWWRATVKTIRGVVKAAKLEPADVAGIGLSGQMHGSVFLDEAGAVLRPAILWNDQRTGAECDEIERRAGGRRRLIKLVANPALTGFQAPKLLWLRNHEPRNFDRLAKVLLPKDEVRRRLTGELATDVSDASGTLLLDVVERRWSRPLLGKLDLDPALLPPCFESHQPTGTLTDRVAKQLGLTTDCVVVAGAGDCAAGAVGNGVVRRGVVNASLGTSGVVFSHSETPEYDPEGRLHTFCHAVDGKWHLMGVTLTAAGALQWFADTLNAGAAAGQRASIPRLIDEAAATPVGAEGVQFLPYLAGERTPHADPLARGAFVGLTLKHTRGHLVRAVMEGVTLALRDSLDVMQELGVPVREVRATGGGAKSPFWRQMQADVFGKRVTAMEADEGPALGAALLAAVGCGEFKHVGEACQAVVAAGEHSTPAPRSRRYYDRAATVYRGLYASLRDDLHKLHELA